MSAIRRKIALIEKFLLLIGKKYYIMKAYYPK